MDLKDTYFAIPIHDTQTVSQVQLPREVVPVQLPTLRPFVSSMGRYQDPEASISLSSENGGQADSIY